MKSIHTLIFLPLLIFGISCDTTDDPTPDESPDLPVITDFEVAQSQWVPQWIIVAYDTVTNSIGVNTSNEESFWSILLENKSNPQIDFTNPFNTEDYSLDFPDKFIGDFGLKGSESGKPIWKANRIDELLVLEISAIYEDSEKTYCSGRLEFFARGDQNPFTLRVTGNFENVRIFDNDQEAQNYLIQTRLDLSLSNK